MKATFLMTLHTAGPLQHFTCGIVLKSCNNTVSKRMTVKGICVCIAVCNDVHFSYRVNSNHRRGFSMSHKVCILLKSITINFSILSSFTNKRFEMHRLVDTLHAGIETNQFNGQGCTYLLPLLYRIDCSWHAVQGVSHIFNGTVNQLKYFIY